jgi:penicillin-binding protein 2
VLLVALLVGCGGDPTPMADSTAPPASAAASTPSPSPIPDTPETTAAAFLSAWDAGDYVTMFSLLSDSSRSTLNQETLAARCREAVQAATVVTATTALEAVLQEGEHAWATYRITWETALVGTLVTETTMSLVTQGGHWGVEWSGDLIWPGLGNGNYLYMEHYIPARANIYDREGLALASEGTIVTLGVVPNQIQDEQALLTTLSEVTGLTPEEIRGRYAGNPAEWWSPVADISAQVSVEYADQLLSMPGLEAREKEGRTYWDGEVAPHVVGWVALVPAEEAETYRRLGYRGDEWVGVAGLERWAEPYLAGRHGGALYLISAGGQTLSTLAEREAEPSRAVHTTLRREFQRQVQEILGDQRGAIVVLDVETGAVRALASGPGFDPNVFVGPGSFPERNAVLSDPDHPLFNRATQGTYPTGSVFKIVTLAAALERGEMSPAESFFCPGYWDGLGANYRKYCWKEEGHGNIALRDALSASCNVTFYSVGQRLDGIDPSILPEFGRAFGLGSETGIEGVIEVAGLVPGPDWRQEVLGQSWFVGDSVNLAIGQGDLKVTPLQVARMVAAVANGGTLYRPYVVERIGEEIVGQPEATGTLPVSAETLTIIQEAMLGVTTSSLGTATHRFTGLEIQVAGKTGSAEAPGADSKPHSWFAAFAPAGDPEIAIVVMAENAGEGSTVAAPMARQVVEAYYGLPLTPLPPPPDATPAPTPDGGP